MPAITYERWAGALRGRRLPAAVVDLDAFDRNLERLRGLVAAAGFRGGLRLATKSVRVPDLLLRALKSGPPFRGLMCYSAEEAALLAGLGADDLLVAYPTVQASDLSALRDLHRAGTKVALVVDDPGQLRALSSALSGVETPFPVVIEADASPTLLGGAVRIGASRSPVRSARSLEGLVAEARRSPGLRAAGLMAYESHIAGLPDANPFRPWTNLAARAVRALARRRLPRLRRELAEAFARAGGTLELFNGGGTGSLESALREPWLTEATAGSALLGPHLADYHSGPRFEPALFFALQVVRLPEPGLAACSGGGYAGSGAPGWDKSPLPWLPAGTRLLPAEGCGEMQTPVRLAPGTRLGLGDPVLFRPPKSGELAERFEEVLLASEGRIVGTAKTYRGHGKAFL